MMGYHFWEMLGHYTGILLGTAGILLEFYLEMLGYYWNFTGNCWDTTGILLGTAGILLEFY